MIKSISFENLKIKIETMFKSKQGTRSKIHRPKYQHPPCPFLLSIPKLNNFK